MGYTDATEETIFIFSQVIPDRKPSSAVLTLPRKILSRLLPPKFAKGLQGKPTLVTPGRIFVCFVVSENIAEVVSTFRTGVIYRWMLLPGL